MHQEYPFLPVTVDYLDDGEVKTDPQFDPYKRPAPLDRGYTNVTFRVLSFTNCAGVTVPQIGQHGNVNRQMNGDWLHE